MKNIISIGIILGLCLIISCKEDEQQSRSYDVKGLVQKGPFINGTSLSIAELNSSLNQTGNVFSTEIRDNTGSFDISGINLTSSFVELSASGYYFDEIKAQVSSSPLTLKALSDLTSSSTVNVNILTHLEKSRVEFLVEEGNTFSEAKETAQAEVLAAFGIDADDLDHSEFLDIAFDNQGGAALLAVSVILQGNRTVGELSELLATISDDIEPDGELNNASLVESLRKSAEVLNLAAIRQNLIQRYSELGSGSAIPNFEAFVGLFLQFTGKIPSATTGTAYEITGLSAILAGVVNASSLSTTVSFEYGTTNAYGNSVAAVQGIITGHVNKLVNADVSLAPATLYHFRLKAENAKGIVYSEDKTFTTLGEAPTASTTKADNIQLQSAILNGLVDANNLPTTVTFEYGTTASYGSSVSATNSPVTGNSNTATGATITGLTTGQLYHFRIKAQNQLGTFVGEDKTFIPFNAIGSFFQGGILAYVFMPGDPGYDPAMVHGLIVAPIEYTVPQEWHGSPLVAASAWGVLPMGIGHGKTNTEQIVTAYAASTRSFAARFCSELNLDGYDDWFLPSVDELKAIDNPEAYTALGLVNKTYWSSCDHANTGGFYIWTYRYNEFGPEYRGKPVSERRSNGFRAMRYF